MKKSICLLFVFLAAMSLQAQTERASGFSVGTNTQADNSSFVLGLPFYEQNTGSEGYSSTSGLTHSQLMRLDISLEACQNDELVSPSKVKDSTGFFLGYDGEMIIFDGHVLYVFPAGTYDSTAYEAVHYNWDSQFGYDSLTSLYMEIYPIYEFFDTLYLDSTELVAIQSTYPGLHGGENTLKNSTSEHGCDSVVHFFVNLCGGIIRDADGNEYNSLFVGHHPLRYCWTQRNLHNAHYNGGDTILYNMVYVGAEPWNEAHSLEVFGRLYNWYGAVNLPEGSTAESAKTIHGGFVTGICPLGWHIPDSLNLVCLQNEDAFGLMSDSLWLETVPGMNATGFNALPAGFYNPVTKRFEDMLGQTYFWSTETHSLSECMVCSLLFGCNKAITDDVSRYFGASVRCVKNQQYYADGTEAND